MKVRTEASWCSLSLLSAYKLRTRRRAPILSRTRFLTARSRRQSWSNPVQPRREVPFLRFAASPLP